MSTTIRVALCAVAVGLAANCSSTNPTAPSGDAGTADATSPAADYASSTIGPAGGSVAASSAASVAIPAGALLSATTITITASPSSPGPAGAASVSKPYVLGPEGLTFSSAVTVTLAFDPLLLPSGASAKDVQLFTAPAGSSNFTALATQLLDATHVSAHAAHFSVFVAVVRNADASVPGDGGGGDATLSDASGESDGGSAATSADATGSSSADAGGLAGTWTVTTTAMGAPVVTTVTIGQDSLDITSPDFTLTATRTGPVLVFTDHDPPGDANTAVLSATQEAGAFNAGMVPFDLGGSWTIQAGPKGAAATVTCTLNVTAAEIDGACQVVTPAGPWFTFTTQKMSGAASSFGDFGGKWLNTWTWSAVAPFTAGTFPCELDFTGNNITTCTAAAMNVMDDAPVGSPLAGIMFTYDGMNTVSGSAQGWAEFSATR